MTNEPTEKEILQSQIEEAIERLETGDAKGALELLRETLKRLAGLAMLVLALVGSLVGCGDRPVPACGVVKVLVVEPCPGTKLYLKQDGVWSVGNETDDSFKLRNGWFQGGPTDACRFEVRDSRLVGAECNQKGDLL